MHVHVTCVCTSIYLYTRCQHTLLVRIHFRQQIKVMYNLCGHISAGSSKGVKFSQIRLAPSVFLKRFIIIINIVIIITIDSIIIIIIITIDTIIINIIFIISLL